MDTMNQNPGSQTPPQAPATPPVQPPSPDSNPNMGMAILAYLGILVIIPLVSQKKNDPFVKFHCKQGLVVLIGWIVASVVLAIPGLGWVIGPVVWLGALLLTVLGIVNVTNNKMEPLPLVGHLGDKFNI